MAYANSNGNGRVSFEWDEDDVELFEDLNPAPARTRAPRHATPTPAPARPVKRARSSASPKSPSRPKANPHPRCERCAAEARENALPGVSKADRISVPDERHPGLRYVLAIFSPRLIGISLVLLLATSFVKGIVG